MPDQDATFSAITEGLKAEGMTDGGVEGDILMACLVVYMRPCPTCLGECFVPHVC